MIHAGALHWTALVQLRICLPHTLSAAASLEARPALTPLFVCECTCMLRSILSTHSSGAPLLCLTVALIKADS